MIRLVEVTQNIIPPRMLLAFSNRWKGARPAIIMESDGPGHATINLQVNGVDDKELLRVIRLSESGTTLAGVPVYEIREMSPQAEMENDTLQKYGQCLELLPNRPNEYPDGFMLQILAAFPLRV